MELRGGADKNNLHRSLALTLPCSCRTSHHHGTYMTWYFYHPHTKYDEGNVFSLSVHRGVPVRWQVRWLVQLGGGGYLSSVLLYLSLE